MTTPVVCVRKTDRQINRQTDRQIDRLTDKQTDKENVAL